MFVFIIPRLDFSGSILSDEDGIREGKYGERTPLIGLRLFLLYFTLTMGVLVSSVPIVGYYVFDLSVAICRTMLYVILGVFTVTYWLYCLTAFKSEVGDLKHFFNYCDYGLFGIRYAMFVLSIAVASLPRDMVFAAKDSLSVIITIAGGLLTVGLLITATGVFMGLIKITADNIRKE